MDISINTSMLGIFTYVCAGDYEPMKKIGFALLIIGMIATSVIYQAQKEKKPTKHNNTKLIDIKRKEMIK